MSYVSAIANSVFFFDESAAAIGHGDLITVNYSSTKNKVADDFMAYGSK